MRTRANDADGAGDAEKARHAAPGGQPRPAFGLRPWFALRRRARSLRRFALAMHGRVPATSGDAIPDLLLVDAEGSWRSPPVIVATGAAARLRGLRGCATGRALLLRTRSVHGFGMHHGLTIVGADCAGLVGAVRRLERRTVVMMPAATWMLELPPWVAPPPPGARLVAVQRKLPG